MSKAKKTKSKDKVRSTFGEGLLMSQKEMERRQDIIKKTANKGMMGEIGKVQSRTAQPLLDKLRESSKPMGQPAADPNADLAVLSKASPNEPSVVSDEPTMVQMQRARNAMMGNK